MGKHQLGNSTASDLATVMTDYSVPAEETDGIDGVTETVWDNEKWSQYLGYYKQIPELASVIDAKATWTVGKGFKAKPETELILDTVKGYGKDTFNTILENMIRTYNIGGDSFCEVIRDDEDNLINLKPLDPSSIRIIANKKGRITGYKRLNKGKVTGKLIEAEDIFHLARNRVADEIHGVSMVQRLEWIILAKNEAMQDNKTLLHRYVTPRWIIKLATDKESEILAFKTKMDAANAGGENMYVPQDSVELEAMAVAPNSTLSPLAWIESLDDKFYEAAQVPKIIVGGVGGITEAAVKIAYLAFQQTIEEEQLFIEEQVLNQLNIEIELEFPASLENEMISDNKKDKTDGASQPSETEAAPPKEA